MALSAKTRLWTIYVVGKHIYLFQRPFLFIKTPLAVYHVFCPLSSRKHIASTLQTSHWDVCEVDKSISLRNGIWGLELHVASFVLWILAANIAAMY